MSARFKTEAEFQAWRATLPYQAKAQPGGRETPALPVPEQRRGRMNGLETRYVTEILGPRKYAGEILGFWFEPLRFRLAKNTNYTGDFVIQCPDGWELHEVKGHIWQAAHVRLKVCAEMEPFSLMFKSFYLCRRDKLTGWIIERV
jgi:hypothetical protein